MDESNNNDKINDDEMNIMDRKTYNLMRLKQKEREKNEKEKEKQLLLIEKLKKEEEEKININFVRKSSSVDSTSGQGAVRRKSKEKIVCRSCSTTSNTDSVDYDYTVENGSWYDVFADEAEQQEDRKVPTNAKSQLGTIGGSEKIKRIAEIKRRLSTTPSPPQITPAGRSTNSPSLSTGKTPSPTPINTLFNKMIEKASPNSPTRSEPLELVNVCDGYDTDGSDSHRSSTPSPKRSSDSFRDLRKKIDFQLFNS